MHSLIDLFAYKIYKEKLLPKSDILKMKYAMNVLWNEVVKFSILMAIFRFLNRFDLFMFCTTLLLPIRIFSGGIHFKGQVSCFIGSFVFYALAILILPKLIYMNLYLAIALMTLSLIIIYIYSPIASSFRPILNEKRKRSLKYTSVFFTLLGAFILFQLILPHNIIFFESGIWIIVVQAFQLILGKELG